MLIWFKPRSFWGKGIVAGKQNGSQHAPRFSPMLMVLSYILQLFLHFSLNAMKSAIFFLFKCHKEGSISSHFHKETFIIFNLKINEAVPCRLTPKDSQVISDRVYKTLSWATLDRFLYSCCSASHCRQRNYCIYWRKVLRDRFALLLHSALCLLSIMKTSHYYQEPQI